MAVEARVEVVEYLGNELQLYLNANGSSFVARVSTDNDTHPGADLRVGFDLRRVHLFDKESGAAVR